MCRFILLMALLTLVMTACAGAGSQAGNPAGSPTPSRTPTPTLVLPTITPSTTPLPTETSVPTPTPTPVTYGPTNFPPNINPLTGLPVADPSLLERRPLAIKIQLYPRRARPPWGLSLADIVYEYYHEGGLSRLNAIFYGNDAEQVGPIRSARFSDAHIIRMYRAILAFGSGDYRVRRRLYNAEFSDYLVSEFPASCPPMCRIDPQGWNHLVTNTQQLSQYITDQGLENERPNLGGMYFAVDAPLEGSAATQIVIRYSYGDYHRWTYDPASEQYLREQDVASDTGEGEQFAPFIDRLTNAPVSSANVVVLLVPHEYYSRKPEMIELLLQGSGNAYAFRDGQGYAVCWQRAANNSVLTLMYPNESGGCDQVSEPFPFKPGVTWFEIVGLTSEITSAGGAWRVNFAMP